MDLERDKSSKRLYNTPLMLILHFLIIDLLDTNLHPIFAEDKVLLFHLLACGFAHIIGDAVGDVTDECKDADHNQEDYERNKGAETHFCQLVG